MPEVNSVAIEALYTVGGWLGHGMADLAAVLDPRMFIIGATHAVLPEPLGFVDEPRKAVCPVRIS